MVEQRQKKKRAKRGREEFDEVKNSFRIQGQCVIVFCFLERVQGNYLKHWCQRVLPLRRRTICTALISSFLLLPSKPKRRSRSQY